MKVLLSIKPEFVKKIFEGSKKYEYRKSLFKRDDVSAILIYASSPIKKVVGEFIVDEILSSNHSLLWEKTKDFSGITKDFYDEYFKNKKVANAIKIKDVVKYESPKRLSDYGINQPPQSFCYVVDD